MPAPQRTTTPLFADTPEGMLAKAKTLTELCPDKEAWTCIMGYVEYKLAPSAAHVQEEVVDELVAWIQAHRERIEAERGADAPGDDDMGGATANQLAGLVTKIVQHLYSLGR